MPRQQPIATDDDHRVIPFRPRNVAKPATSPPPTPAPAKPPQAALSITPARSAEVRLSEVRLSEVRLSESRVLEAQISNFRSSAASPPAAAGAASPTRLTPPVAVQPAPRGRGFRDAAEAADFRQRMLINSAAVFFVLFLAGAGVWLATTLLELRRSQACLLASRPDCPRMLNAPSGPPSPSRQFGEPVAEHP